MGKSLIIKLVVGLVVLIIIIFGGWFFMFFWGGEEKNPDFENININAPIIANANSAVINTNANNQNTNSTVVNALVGTWVSDCLVPDVNSDWSEKHQFVIKTDGTAVHTRWSSYDHNCSSTDPTNKEYHYTLPATGQINLADQDGGYTIYDIYQITGQTLLFGHGFQAHYPAGYDATQGNSASHRFSVLNNYIVYYKK